MATVKQERQDTNENREAQLLRRDLEMVYGCALGRFAVSEEDLERAYYFIDEGLVDLKRLRREAENE